MRKPIDVKGAVLFAGETRKAMLPVAENEVRFNFSLYDEAMNTRATFVAVLGILGYDYEEETLILTADENSCVNSFTAVKAARAFLRHTGSVATAKNYLGLGKKEVVRKVQIILIDEEISVTVPKRFPASMLKAQG